MGARKKRSKASYDAKDIDVLEGLEGVRKRPDMYIGSVSDHLGLFKLLQEIVDNSIDEAINGYAGEISVTLHADGRSFSVQDDGRGIPVKKHPIHRKAAVELILTTLHAGGKFDDRNYVASGGLHGVGASVVNALSEELKAVVWRDGWEWEISFRKGKLYRALSKKKRSKKTGTLIYARADKEIFGDLRLDSKVISAYLKEKSYLHKGVRIKYRDEINNTEEEFLSSKGIEDYVRAILKEKDSEAIRNHVFVIRSEEDFTIEIGVCWNKHAKGEIRTYANGIYTPYGGTHEDAFKAGIVKAIRNYMSVHNIKHKGITISAEDIRESLIGVLSIFVPVSRAVMHFEGQTKARLNTKEIYAPVELASRSLENQLNLYPKVAEKVIERIVKSAQTRIAVKRAQQTVERRLLAEHKSTLPGKLSDCSAVSPQKRELFIVEGDSAGGSAKQARDRKTQAILPLRGKILNAVSSSPDKIWDNKEIMSIVAALSCGVGSKLDTKKLRYGKIIIMTDADPDGMHIASLLLGFFFKLMRGIVEEGHLYLAKSPLYRIRCGEGKNQKTYWAYSEAEKDKLLASIKKRKSLVVTRFKGLGEMNPETLWQTTMNPATRTLLRVGFKEEKEAEELLYNLLGKDVSLRNDLIKENARVMDVVI